MRKIFVALFLVLWICADAQVYNGILCNFTAADNFTAPKWAYFSGGSMSLATNTEVGQAAGLVLQSVDEDDIGQAYVAGFVSSWPGGGLVRGPYYLSTTTPGAMTTTKPSPSFQRVGWAVSDTSFIISIEARQFATGYGGGASPAVSVDDANDLASLRSEDGETYFEAGNGGMLLYSQSAGVDIESGINATITAVQNVVVDAIDGDAQFSSEGLFSITSQTGDVGLNGNKIELVADSILLDGVPNNVAGDKTFLTFSNSGAVKKQVGISLEDLNTNTQAWPVGSVFISIVSTNPNTLLGYGTWSAFGTGRVLVGIDAGQTEFDTVEETGGAKTHTLTEAEMPAHTHTYQEPAAPTPVIPSGFGEVDAIIARSAQNTGSTGGGAAHNNLQPYIVVHMWLRTN